jgi:hypothetical protein
MIEAVRVRDEVRWKEKDTDALRFSDYEIWDALNEVLRYVSNRLAHLQSDVTERMRTYRDTNGSLAEEGATLPEDFLSLQGVYRIGGERRLRAIPAGNVCGECFKVSGNRLYVCGDFKLCYYAALGVVGEGDTIPLPEAFFDMLVKLTRMVLAGAENDVMMQTVISETEAIVPRRRYNHMRLRMPFDL